MESKHPYWEDKGAGDGKIPEKCPLKNEQLTVVYKLDVE